MIRPARGRIGEPLDRVDGPAKVTGRATYAADYRGTRVALIGFIVGSPMGKGRIRRLETTAAEQTEGVRLVLTHRNAPAQAPFGEPESADRFTQSHGLMRIDRVLHSGYPVAFVVAETLEQARHAASLVEVEIDEEAGLFDALAHPDASVRPESCDGGAPADTDAGDFETSFAGSEVTLEREYLTPNQHAAAMEPHATVAEWRDGALTVHMSIQILVSARLGLARTLGIAPEAVRVVSPYIGGGFGSKLGIHDEAILAALAAKVLDRPVRVAQTRRNVFVNAPHRSAVRQTLRIGADRNGRLHAISHASLAAMARDYAFCEPTASPTRASYAADALHTTHRVVEADIPKVDSMRAPGEAIGTLSLETAIDEVAEQCGLDPLEFRLRNAPQTDPTERKPFSTRRMEDCLREGAARFGWQPRPGRAPGRDGRWLVGRGMAAAIRPNFLEQASAQVELRPDGHLIVRLDMTDIGTGTYTILTQIAAETMGMRAADVTVRLGDTDFPETSGSGGSSGAASSGSALLEACRNLRSRLLQRASNRHESWRTDAEGAEIVDGVLTHGERRMALADLLDDALTAEGRVEPGRSHDDYAQYSYGGLFAEVGVDCDTGEIRLRRMLGAFDAGRILNPKTTRSQLMGGMIFGIGAALFEESLLDPRYGAFMNCDLAEYHLAVNRDVPPLEVHVLEGYDPHSNEMGSKGVGELGICGAGPAIANAIHDAVGFRARRFPIHVEDILPFLPSHQ